MTIETPPGTRLILASENLLEQFGTRTERGERITAEWGDPSPQGWYEPRFTAHTDDRIGLDVERLARAMTNAFRMVAVEHWPFLRGDGWPAYFEDGQPEQVLLVDEIAAAVVAEYGAEKPA